MNHDCKELRVLRKKKKKKFKTLLFDIDQIRYQNVYILVLVSPQVALGTFPNRNRSRPLGQAIRIGVFAPQNASALQEAISRNKQEKVGFSIATKVLIQPLAVIDLTES